MVKYDNGAIYVRTHFISILIGKKTYNELEAIAKSYNAMHCNKAMNVFNAMFQNEKDAKDFASSL